jgi:hypothetical protein
MHLNATQRFTIMAVALILLIVGLAKLIGVW